MAGVEKAEPALDVQLVFAVEPQTPPEPLLERRLSWYDRALSPMGSGSQRGSIFLLVSGAIGAGIVALPYTVTLCGVPLSLLLLYVASAAALLSLQICCVAQRTLMLSSYDAVLSELFSPAMRSLCVFMLASACFGIACLYLILASQSLAKLLGGGDSAAVWWQDRRVLVLLLEGLICGPLGYLRSLSEFRYASLIGVLAISYFVVLTIGVFAVGDHSKPVSARWWNEVQSSSDVLRAWAIFISAYIVHNFIFPVSDGLANPTAGRMNKVLIRSTVIQVVTYTLVSIAGFVTFKQKTPQNLLMAFDTSSNFVIAGQCAMLVQLAVAHTMMYHPMRTYAWAFLRGSNAVLSRPMHVAVTTVLIVPVTFISVVTPDIVPLMGVVGGFAGVTYAFTIPSAILVRLQGYEMQGPGSDWMTTKRTYYAGMTFLGSVALSGYLSGILHILDLLGVKM